MALSAKAAARYVLAAAAAIVLPASIVAAASIAHPADHSASRHAVRAASGPARGASGGVAQPGPVVMRPASVAPRGAFDRILSARQAASAAQSCAGYATYAGFTNNATNDELVTASAICVAESGGQPTVYYCNPTGQDGYYPPVSCSGMYDRGLWQIDNQAWTSISDTCAFTAKCNADGAYTISQRGASFSPWATYTSGTYSNYLTAAQSAVRALRGGTLPSGVAGVCLSRAGYAQNALAITSTCGSGTGRQQWRVGRPGDPRRRPTASRSRRRAARQRFICAGATGAATSSGPPWATACCATPWAAGACATRAAPSPREPRSTWARAS